MLTHAMTHLTLYRKYRPQRFSDVVGQDHVTQTLKRAAAEDKVAHAYVFSGPRGAGKTSTARILAKRLNCLRGQDEPCGECPSCVQIASGTSLDVVEIDAASHGSVDDARDIRERVAYASVGGKWRVYIIDECHMLSPAANNALLKVLEEPPEQVVFVFATTEPQKVLQTLIDRCQRYEFRALGARDIAGLLERISEAEGVAADAEALQMIASRAEGSARDALTILDQLISYSSDKVTVEALTAMLGSLPDGLLFEAADLISERDAGATLVFADRLIRSGVDPRQFVRSLVDHLRSLFILLHAPAAQEILETTDDHLDRLKAQSNHFDSAEILRLIDLANEVQLQLRQAVDGRLALEVGLLRMTRPELHATPAALMARLEAIEKLGGSPAPGIFSVTEAPVVAAVPIPKQAPPVASAAAAKKAVAKPADPPKEVSATPAAVVDPSEIDLDKVLRAWPLVLEKVKRRKISFQALLLAATPVAWRDGELVLEFGPRSGFHRDRVSDPAQHVPLLEGFAEVLGVRPKITCVRGEEPEPHQPEPHQPEAPDSGGGDESGRPPRDAIDVIREAFSGSEVVDE